MWEPHFVGQDFARDCMIHGLYKFYFFMSKAKESFSARKDYFQPKDDISSNNILSFATRNYSHYFVFLLQVIISGAELDLFLHEISSFDYK